MNKNRTDKNLQSIYTSEHPDSFDYSEFSREELEAIEKLESEFPVERVERMFDKSPKKYKRRFSRIIIPTNKIEKFMDKHIETASLSICFNVDASINTISTSNKNLIRGRIKIEIDTRDDIDSIPSR
jgi:hypothetical protein